MGLIVQIINKSTILPKAPCLQICSKQASLDLQLYILHYILLLLLWAAKLAMGYRYRIILFHKFHQSFQTISPVLPSRGLNCYWFSRNSSYRCMFSSYRWMYSCKYGAGVKWASTWRQDAAIAAITTARWDDACINHCEEWFIRWFACWLVV